MVSVHNSSRESRGTELALSQIQDVPPTAMPSPRYLKVPHLRAFHTARLTSCPEFGDTRQALAVSFSERSERQTKATFYAGRCSANSRKACTGESVGSAARIWMPMWLAPALRCSLIWA